MVETGKIKSFLTKICPIITGTLNLIATGLIYVPIISLLRYGFTGQPFIVHSIRDISLVYGAMIILYSFSELFRTALSGLKIRNAIWGLLCGVTVLLAYIYQALNFIAPICILCFLCINDKPTESPAKPDNLNDVLQYITDDYEI